MAAVCRQLARPRLIAITDPARFGLMETRAMVEQLCGAAEPHTVLVQLRAQELCLRERYHLGVELGQLCCRFEQALCVNDRLDLALALNASSVHLKRTSLAVADTRHLLTDRFGHSWLSQAWHGSNETFDANVDALLVSPAMQPRKGRPALGLMGLQQLAADSKAVPLYALGGVTADAAPSLLAAGMTGVAAIEECYVRGRALLESLHIAR